MWGNVDAMEFPLDPNVWAIPGHPGLCNEGKVNDEDALQSVREDLHDDWFSATSELQVEPKSMRPTKTNPI